MTAVDVVPPHFELARKRRIPRLSYPEDRLREVFLARHPQFRTLPVNLKARKKTDAHIADKFAAIQLRAMQEQNMSEEEAYNYAINAATDGLKRISSQETSIGDAVSSESETDQATQLYMASLKDSMKDIKLYELLRSEKRIAKPSDAQNSGSGKNSD